MSQLDHIERELQVIKSLLLVLLAGERTIMLDLSALAAQVKATTDAEASALVLIHGLADRLTATAGDPAAVAALAKQLKDGADSLSAAILANTPADPNAPPAPSPPPDVAATPA